MHISVIWLDDTCITWLCVCLHDIEYIDGGLV